MIYLQREVECLFYIPINIGLLYGGKYDDELLRNIICEIYDLLRGMAANGRLNTRFGRPENQRISGCRILLVTGRFLVL